MTHNFLGIGRWLIALCALALAGCAVPASAPMGEGMMAVEPQTLKFAPVPGAPGCATAAAVRGDPAKGPSVLLIKLASGCRVPWHWHSVNEQLMVVSGTGALEMKDGKRLTLHAGAYASLPNHQVHQAACSSNCMFFNSSDGVFDIHYVDASGNEISPEAALKKPAPPKAPPASKTQTEQKTQKK